MVGCSKGKSSARPLMLIPELEMCEPAVLAPLARPGGMNLPGIVYRLSSLTITKALICLDRPSLGGQEAPPPRLLLIQCLGNLGMVSKRVTTVGLTCNNNANHKTLGLCVCV